MRMYKIAEYIKMNHSDLYQRRHAIRKYYGKDLWTINIASITKEELDTIRDTGISQDIIDLRRTYKIYLLSLVIPSLVIIIKMIAM